jgi:hypothetical protein
MFPSPEKGHFGFSATISDAATLFRKSLSAAREWREFLVGIRDLEFVATISHRSTAPPSRILRLANCHFSGDRRSMTVGFSPRADATES